MRKYDGNISSEKSLNISTLFMSWYGHPAMRTDYAVMRFSYGMYYTFLSYKNNEKELNFTFNMTVNHELIVNIVEIILAEQEKQQSSKIMQETFRGHLLFDNVQNSEYIKNN